MSERQGLGPGLYVVATPIGHLEDISLRALWVLGQVDAIAAEDTRTAQKLLRAHGIHKPTFSLYRDNEAHRSEQILERIEGGEAIALISEAGTPCISDPGFLLIRALREAGCAVVPIPGASALIAALSASGMPCHHFCFLGFLPVRSGRRKKAVEPYTQVPGTLIFYEAPHRILELLDDLQQLLGDRKACIGRELTKLHEEFLHGSLSALRRELEQRDAILGEFVLMVEGLSEEARQQLPEASDPQAEIQAAALSLLATGGKPTRLARKLTAQFPFLSRNDAYQILRELREASEAD